MVADEIKQLDEELLELWRVAGKLQKWTKPAPIKRTLVYGICKVCRREFPGKELRGMKCVECRRTKWQRHESPRNGSR